MKLIPNFDISPFLQMVWISEEAKKTWEQPIRDCSAIVSELELLSVVEGHRRCGWQSINVTNLPNFEHKCAEMGLVTLIVRFSAGFKGFAHKFQPIDHVDDKTNVPVIFARNITHAKQYLDSYNAGDHVRQGEWLGFPGCCRDFFNEVWAKGFYDPIEQISRDNGFHPYSNPVLRYIGLRVGFHIPCSFHCDETIKLAEQRMELAYEKFPQQAKLLEALLAMPMSWDTLHGIAVVRTPIFYIITSSVPCEKKHVVEINGDFIPRESATGLIFPFQIQKSRPYLDGKI